MERRLFENVRGTKRPLNLDDGIEKQKTPSGWFALSVALSLPLDFAPPTLD